MRLKRFTDELDSAESIIIACDPLAKPTRPGFKGDGGFGNTVRRNALAKVAGVRSGPAI